MWSRVREIIRDERKPIKFLASRALCRSGLCQALTIQRQGYRLRFFPTCLSAELWVYSSRMHDERFLERYLDSGNTYVDVGANIGTLALKAASIVGDSGRVIAYEAHPRTFGYLARNVQLNAFGNLILKNVALGERKGTVSFSDKTADDQNRVMPAGGVLVTMERLDDALDAPRIDLLKIDVEGYEKFVLEGGRKVLGRTSCVLFEAWEEHARKFGYTTGDLIRLFHEEGFLVFELREHSIIEVPQSYVAEQCLNLLAIRDTAAFAARTGLHPC